MVNAWCRSKLDSHGAAGKFERATFPDRMNYISTLSVKGCGRWSVERVTKLRGVERLLREKNSTFSRGGGERKWKFSFDFKADWTSREILTVERVNLPGA